MKISYFFILLTSVAYFMSCNEDDEPDSNIQLYDKPLSVIKSHILGKWRLVKAEGGICATCGAQLENNPYMIIDGDSITAGNDMRVTLNTTIEWKWDEGVPTYLLCYEHPAPGAEDDYMVCSIVDRIRNDTLIIIDRASDPVYSYYLK